ncbi:MULTISPECIES: hypothetical protein [unclassified Pseudoalteromonas]|uniref:hypothetical protein n=1 Tax=unclassified Pseudoalteromonas TaxID=194690 RepID=UPI001EFE4752|nr:MULTISPECIES: hypothetical protein [unclassified Pseudoalteromonas]MCG9710382.1 hypothetical protein [Pseudoalteromonas sp. Isolate3]MCP4586599.1 hypothetical protein [Pseudoalteromonas sp.]URQ89053.1 hypothetical protein J8Z25_09540 [Pseudoalteromonas sp. SCSIO 43101]
MKTARWFVASFLLLFTTTVFASKEVVIEKSDKFTALSKGFKVSVRTGPTKNAKIYDFSTKKITIADEHGAPFQRYYLQLVKANKEWAKEIVTFDDKTNVIDLNALLFGQLIDTSELKKLDSAHAFSFYNRLERILSEEYGTFEQVYRDGLADYLSYMSIEAGFDNYIARTGIAGDKLIQALKKVNMPPLVEHQQLITEFIKAVNQKDKTWLLAQQQPNSSQRASGIYARGLNVLFEYFDRIGNPTKFNIIRETQGRSFDLNSNKYFIIELLEHKGQREKVEMEFMFVDTYGGRFIAEYDITGVHFR